jgi:Cu/Ag efflux protein CusF
MCKKIALALLSLCLIISMTGAALAQETPKKASAKPAVSEAPKGKQMLGEVVKVDAKAKQVVVRTQDGEKTFNAAKAKFSGYQTLADVKTGDKVAILYDDKGEKLTAQLIANHAEMMKAPHPPAK